MALPVISARNQVQKTNKRMIPLTNDVVQPTVWYTCPTGKVAIIRGTCVCESTGAAATVNLEMAGVAYAIWNFSGGSDDINILSTLNVGLTINFEAHLAAGDTVETTQNTGTNAQIKLQAEIEEFNI